MKIKASWIAFIPIMVGTLFLHFYYTFFIGGGEITQKLFGDYYLLINEKTEPQMIVVLCAIMFGFALLFYIIDRKTAPGCELKSGFLNGVFLILAALLLGVDSSVSIMNAISGETSSAFSLFQGLLGIITALIFAIVGMGSLISFNIAKKIRIFMLIPTAWAVVGMLNSFVSHRQEAPSFSFFDTFAWVFLALFLFYSSMVLCGIEIKNPVKSSFLFGFPAILFITAYSVTSIKQSMDELGSFELTAVIPQLALAALGLFALSYLGGLSGSMKRKTADGTDFEDEVEGEWRVVDEDEEEDVPEAAFGVGSTKYVTAEFEKIRLEKAAQKAKERTGSLPTVTDGSTAEGEPAHEEKPLSTLDKIDQLIMELSEDDSK